MFSSHQAVKLEVVGHLFFEKWCFGSYLRDQWHCKIGEIGEMALQSVTLKMKQILKMSYFLQPNEESFASMHGAYNIFMLVGFSFPVKRTIKLTIIGRETDIF